MRVDTGSVPATCPCGSGRATAACCLRFIRGDEPAPDAPALMRSRYTAFVLRDEAYLLGTWHASTRPARALSDPPPRWLGLEVRGHGPDPAAPADPDRACVEFVARWREGGRGHRMHVTSRFAREDGRWFYVDDAEGGSGTAL